MALVRKEAYFNSSNGQNKIRTYIWEDDELTPVGIVQLAHGMAEHIARASDTESKDASEVKTKMNNLTAREKGFLYVVTLLIIVVLAYFFGIRTLNKKYDEKTLYLLYSNSLFFSRLLRIFFTSSLLSREKIFSIPLLTSHTSYTHKIRPKIFKKK